MRTNRWRLQWSGLQCGCVVALLGAVLLLFFFVLAGGPMRERMRRWMAPHESPAGNVIPAPRP